jgi:transposase, IS5 family
MFRTIGDGPSPWEALLPPELLRLPAELGRVDALLDDPAFFAPFAPHFHPLLGRPSTPVECYLRLMFLKFRYRLGYESLCAEVSDSISWRRFCRIPLDGAVPHPTTLMKITTRCGEEAVAGLNEALLVKAAGAKLLRLGKVRADTTVVAANVAYPSDAGLLGRAVVKMGRLVRRVKAADGASRTAFRDRSRAAGRRARALASTLRRRLAAAGEEPQAAVARITLQLAGLTAAAAREAARVARNARRALRSAAGRRAGRLRRALAELTTLLARSQRVIAQTRSRFAGVMPAGATRLVSLHDPDARPIRKGKIGTPVEFGYKAQLIDNDDGVVLDHQVLLGNPPDAPLLAPAIQRVTGRFGCPPRAVTADRGYGEAHVDRDLQALGVQTIAIPRKGKPSPARRATEHRPPFRRLVKWRTGCEGRISYLKRGYGWDRSRLDGLGGTQTWCGHAVLAHNLVKIAALTA